MLDASAPVPEGCFDLRSSVCGTTRTVVCAGELDLASSSAFEAAVATAIGAEPETVVIDLSAVVFIDSTGVHALMRARRHAEARHVRLVIIPAPDRVHEVFAICGVETELPFVPGRVECIGGYTHRGSRP
jgi:anti-sigma B factor antagonist